MAQNTREFVVRPIHGGDREWVRALLAERWHGPQIVTRGRIWQADELPGFVAEEGGQRLGLATYAVADVECELVSLDSLAPGRGVGTALVAAVAQAARTVGSRRLWLVTTNDNLPALRFYQERGFALVAVHCNALEVSRRLKPEIPSVGLGGVPLLDELELEVQLLQIRDCGAVEKGESVRAWQLWGA